jgi:hypothetical protein
MTNAITYNALKLTMKAAGANLQREREQTNATPYLALMRRADATKIGFVTLTSVASRRVRASMKFGRNAWITPTSVVTRTSTRPAIIMVMAWKTTAAPCTQNKQR